MEKPDNSSMEKILRVDLSNGKTGIEPLPEEMIKLYIGGRGIGAKLLFDEVKLWVDPLAPLNLLILKSIRHKDISL
jgi:aldehyde:ferredoxin oxidoreductase